MKVMIVEENELNREILARRLRRRGFELSFAEHGEAALALAASDPPALILMDLSMPIMDGWEATRRLKADPKTRSIPVIALTAHAMEGDRQRAMAAGCDDFDTKPIQLERLLDKMSAFLGEIPAPDPTLG